MKALNKQTAPKSVAPERIIQFGEGNFLRAFVDWIVYNMNQKTDFNSSVVVVQPIERGMAEWLNGQDCLYHVNLQGRLNGEATDCLPTIPLQKNSNISTFRLTASAISVPIICNI